MRRWAAVLLLGLAACSAPRALRPEEQLERAPDPEAERSLERRLQGPEVLHVEVLQLERILIAFPEPEFKKPDYGLYVNPIP
jgi:hypothetical protein